MTGAPIGIFIYDSDCGFCNRYVSFVSSFQSFVESVQVSPYSEMELGSLGLTEEDCQHAAQWVTRSGTVRSGSDAIAESLVATRSPLLEVLGRIIMSGLFQPWSQAGYRWVANHRSLLPGGSPSCGLALGPSSSLGSPPLLGKRSESPWV